MDLDPNRWQQCKAQLREQHFPQPCPPWLEPLQLTKISSTKVIFVGVPHQIYVCDIRNHHEELLRSLLEEHFPEFGSFRMQQFEYQVGQGANPVRPVQEEFGFLSPEPVEAAPALETLPKSPAGAQPSTKRHTPSKTSSKTLDTVVVGNHNQLAFRAAEMIVRAPGEAYSPFLLYGAEGSGKTYLLEAIAEELRLSYPDLNIVFLSAEAFLNEFVRHIRTKQMQKFREQYRQVDVFIIDDVQALSSSPQCQTELKHTLSTLRQENKQILLSCNRLPSQIPSLNKTLTSKMESGLSLDIPSPDEETCKRLLERKARQTGILLSQSVSAYLARHLPPNITQLEAALTRLGAHSSLMGEAISLELVQRLLGQRAAVTKQQPALPEVGFCEDQGELEDQIIEKVCHVLRVSQEELRSGRRDSRVVKARQFVTFLLKDLCGLSLSQIGSKLGRSHSTIHHALRSAEKNQRQDELFARQLSSLQREFQAQLDLPPIRTQAPPLPSSSQADAAWQLSMPLGGQS